MVQNRSATFNPVACPQIGRSGFETHPDADLLERLREAGQLETAYERLNMELDVAIWHSMEWRVGDRVGALNSKPALEVENRLTPLRERLECLDSEIADIPAHSLEGIIHKLRFLAGKLDDSERCLADSALNDLIRYANGQRTGAA